MKGLEQARHYYEGCGREAFSSRFTACWSRAAVGLVGEGSECFGYDDAVSTDHDFGAGFCIWLTPEDYQKYGQEMAQAYEDLPVQFDGLTKRPDSERGGQRVGVWSIEGFYQTLIGFPGIPEEVNTWMAIADHRLAAATNGAVFEDPLGQFTRIREGLLSGRPEIVWKQKLAYQLHALSQTGQYNYARCMQRSDSVTAAICLSEFAKAAMAVAFLLNKRYAPYYKWTFKAAQELPKLGEVAPLLISLSLAPDQRDKWRGTDPMRWRYQINTEDDCVRAIEKICARIVVELRETGLSQCDSDFLDHHCPWVLGQIKK